MSPKRSPWIPGGESGERASRTPSPKRVVTTTPTATSRLSPGTRATSAIASAATTIAGAPPTRSGAPAIAARTRPGKIECASDSAA